MCDFRLWGETQARSKCHQRASLWQLERLRVVIFILWALARRWTGRENICNFMVSSGEIWFQMAGSLINRNCCLRSFPKGIEERVHVSLTSKSLCVQMCTTTEMSCCAQMCAFIRSEKKATECVHVWASSTESHFRVNLYFWFGWIVAGYLLYCAPSISI